MFRCHICSKVCSSMRGLTLHISAIHPLPKEKPASKKNTTSVASLPPPDCGVDGWDDFGVQDGWVAKPTVTNRQKQAMIDHILFSAFSGKSDVVNPQDIINQLQAEYGFTIPLETEYEQDLMNFHESIQFVEKLNYVEDFAEDEDTPMNTDYSGLDPANDDFWEEYDNNVFGKDRMRGNFSETEEFSLELMNLLHQFHAPLYAYDQIIALVEKAVHQKIEITPTFRSKRSALKHFSQRFNLGSLKPDTEFCPKFGTIYPIIKHDATAMIYSLLHHPILFQDKNLTFFNNDNPLAPPPRCVTNIGEFHTGNYCRDAHKHLCKNYNDLLLPIVFYLDKLTMDKAGHLSLEPLFFTLGIFNSSVRNTPEAWRPLGYIPNFNLTSKSESQKHRSSSEKLQFYHDIIGKIQASMVALQNGPGLPFKFSYRGTEYRVNLKPFILVYQGDTETHDKLCGKFSNRNMGTARLCRQCDCPTLSTDDPFYEGTHTLPEDFKDMSDPEALQKFSQHPIRNTFYHDSTVLPFIERGIHGMTPGEPLHVINLGLFKYMVEGFNIAIGGNPDSSNETKLQADIDKLARWLGRALQHQSDRGIPRTYFPNGVLGGTKLAGHEYTGVMLVLLVCLHSTDGCKLLEKHMEPKDIRKWQQLLTNWITFVYWLKLTEIPYDEIVDCEYAIVHLLRDFKDIVPRNRKSGFNIIKFHIPLHFMANALNLGAVANIDTGPREANHIENAKNPSKCTQQRADSIEDQTSLRYVSQKVLSWATAHCTGGDSQGTRVDSHHGLVDEKDEKEIGYPTTRFEMYINLDADSGDEVKISPIFEWKSTVGHQFYRKHHVEWVFNHVVTKLGLGKHLTGFTDYKRNGILFRGHPSYRSGSAWHDWALFEWATDDGNVLVIPGHIVMFLELPEECIGIQVGSGTCIEHAGVHVLMESLEEPLQFGTNNLGLCATGNKYGGKKHLKNPKKRKPMDSIQSSICLVSVDAIFSPIAAISDIGGIEGEYIFTRPSDEWAKMFSAYIEREAP